MDFTKLINSLELKRQRQQTALEQTTEQLKELRQLTKGK